MLGSFVSYHDRRFEVVVADSEIYLLKELDIEQDKIYLVSDDDIDLALLEHVLWENKIAEVLIDVTLIRAYSEIDDQYWTNIF